MKQPRPARHPHRVGTCRYGEDMTDQSVPAPQPDELDGVEAWTWSLMVSQGGNAVELYRDGVHRLTVPLDDLQTEILMGKPVTLASAIAADPQMGPRVEIRSPEPGEQRGLR